MDFIKDFSMTFRVTEIQGLSCWSFLFLENLIIKKSSDFKTYANSFLSFFFFKHYANNTNLHP